MGPAPYNAVDMVHGHSSHHVKGMEVYRGKPIFYGCGDFLTDYEGISGHEEYRGELSLMNFPRMDPSTGELAELRMVPMRTVRFRLERASLGDAHWLAGILNREEEQHGVRVEVGEDSTLAARWE